MSVRTCGGQKRLSGPLELDFLVFVSPLMWVLGTKVGPVQEQQML